MGTNPKSQIYKNYKYSYILVSLETVGSRECHQTTKTLAFTLLLFFRAHQSHSVHSLILPEHLDTIQRGDKVPCFLCFAALNERSSPSP
jgi:hypothetical protein